MLNPRIAGLKMWPEFGHLGIAVPMPGYCSLSSHHSFTNAGYSKFYILFQWPCFSKFAAGYLRFLKEDFGIYWYRFL